MCAVLEEVALSKFDARFLSPWGSSAASCSDWLISDVFLNLLRHSDEGLLNVDRILGRGLKEGDLKVTSELCTLLCTDLANLLHVAFVANEDLADSWVGEPLDLVHPLSHVIEGVPVGHIIHDDDTVCASVVAACQSSEALLSCCVPLHPHSLLYRTYDLKLHNLFVEHDGLDFLKANLKWMLHLRSRRR